MGLPGLTLEVKGQENTPYHLPPALLPPLPYHLCQLVDGGAQGVDDALVPRVCAAQERSQLSELRTPGCCGLLGTKGQGDRADPSGPLWHSLPITGSPGTSPGQTSFGNMTKSLNLLGR